MKNVCFYIYRVKQDRQRIPWHRPIGGLVLKPQKMVGDVAVADIGLAEEIASHRYHCHPGEMLILAEVFEEYEQRRALQMHRRYERDREEFLELMKVG